MLLTRLRITNIGMLVAKLHEFYLWIIYGQFTGIYVEKEGNTNGHELATKRSSPPAGAKGNAHELAMNLS